ncbi:MAG: GTP-binding protein [Promethearchaeota archaeon]|nr:MAG: GTP-binding protein [Candidatus Lokiarchaeota archaeon]
MSKQSLVLKLLTVGDGGVGKTTLLHRYKEDEFITNTQMTLGVAFVVQEVNIDGTMVMLQIWDFGGQEQFRFMLQRYALGARGAVVMFDLTRLISLEHIEEWVNICRKDNPNLPLILVGTKLDLDEHIMVGDDLALEAKEQYNLFDYIKASSKTGEGVHETFSILARKIIELEKAGQRR